MSTYTTIIGVDVSKDQLDTLSLSKCKKEYSQKPNRSSCISSWLHSIDKSSTLVVLEPTGAYSCRLLHYLNQYGIATALVNPVKSNGYAKAQGIINKNDQQAALTLAMMGKTLALPLYQHPSAAMLKRKQLLSGLNALKKQRQMLKNQLHALDHQIIYEQKVVVALQTTLQAVEDQIQSLEEELDTLTDEEHDDQLCLIQSIVGIGPKTAQLILATTGGIQNFKRAKQLSKFVGTICSSHTSGSSVRKRGAMTKHGNSALRASLYMAARSAKKYNFACKALYERLRAKGKPHKKAMVAVMNKLLKQAFGVVNAGVSFDNQYYLKYSKN